MKKYYPIQVIDLMFQLKYVTPKKIGLVEDYDEDPFDTHSFVIILKHREFKKVSDWKKLSGVGLI